MVDGSFDGSRQKIELMTATPERDGLPVGQSSDRRRRRRWQSINSLVSTSNGESEVGRIIAIFCVIIDSHINVCPTLKGLHYIHY